MTGRLTRRRLLRAGAVGLGGLLAGPAFAAAGRRPEAVEVLPVEDLMREHGVLRRLLLVYEDIGRRAGTGATPLPALGAAAGLIHRFIEDYHEKLEEDYVFPTFEKAGRLTGLTAVLRTQHEAGRAITTQLEQLAAAPAGAPADRVRALLAAFLRMYRPHAAREDTVLFPQFAATAGPARYREDGDTFEAMERRLFGPDGFTHVVEQVQQIEQQLGIYRLEQFTASGGELGRTLLGPPALPGRRGPRGRGGPGAPPPPGGLPPG